MTRENKNVYHKKWSYGPYDITDWYVLYFLAAKNIFLFL